MKDKEARAEIERLNRNVRELREAARRPYQKGDIFCLPGGENGFRGKNQTSKGTMNASEFNTELKNLISLGMAEGVLKNKMAFETMIGIIERHKIAVDNSYSVSQAMAMDQQKPIIVPPNGIQLPPRS
jgi:hypothetical protein